MEERYKKVIDENWKEPEFMHESYDNLIDYVKRLVIKIESFIISEKQISYQEGFKKAMGEVREASCNGCKNKIQSLYGDKL